jgi:malate permease and related proteins
MLEVVLPIIGGKLLGHFGVFREEQEKVLINYVMYFALPILAFKAGHQIKLGLEVIKISSLAWASIVLCMLVAYFIARLYKLSNKDLRTFLLVSSFGNTAFLGYPYAFSYFGQEGLQIAIIYDNLGSFLMVSFLGVMVASGKPDLREVLLFPPFLGLVLGFVLRGIPLHPSLDKALEFVALSTLPVVLFALGLSLSLSGIRDNLKFSLLAILIKVSVSILAVYLVGRFMELSPVAFKVSLLESAMPPMMFSAVLALRYNLNPNLAFATVGLGIALSFLYLPFVVKYCGGGI